MSNKKHQHKANVRKVASRPAPAHPGSPNLKHSTPSAPGTPRKPIQKNTRKGILRNPLALIFIGVGVVVLVVVVIFLLNIVP